MITITLTKDDAYRLGADILSSAKSGCHYAMATGCFADGEQAQKYKEEAKAQLALIKRIEDQILIHDKS
jgi:hypothetical protein